MVFVVPAAQSTDMELRILVVGSSGPSQFSLTNSILGREEFSKDVTSIVQSRKNLGDLAGTRVAVVNGPNLYGKHLCKCLSAPGPHALLMAFDLEQICPNDVKTPKLMVKRFGEDALSHTIVLLAYEGDVDILALENRVSTDWHLRELIEQCGGRYHVFNKNWRDRSRDKLLEKMDDMVRDNGCRFYSNHQYQEAEERIQTEERFIMKGRKKEMLTKRKELESRYTGEGLEKELLLFETRIRVENREKAERKISEVLGFTLTAVDYAAAVGKGAALGALCGAVMGFEGMAVGAAVGAVVGGVIGGAASAAWGYVTNAAAQMNRR
uniref:AIG1-type G domain-containing protein n=1 Tax=Hucho hucho TaxID=62062 RepID=A0A4W5JTZ4_9TELE